MEVLTDTSHFYEQLASYNEPKYHWEKLNEELAELLTLTTKKLTKNKSNQPNNKEIIEEMGDVILRIKILSKINGWDNEVKERVELKKSRLQIFMNEGRYKGGV